MKGREEVLEDIDTILRGPATSPSFSVGDIGQRPDMLQKLVVRGRDCVLPRPKGLLTDVDHPEKVSSAGVCPRFGNQRTTRQPLSAPAVFRREVAKDIVEQFLGEVHLEATESDCGDGEFMGPGNHRRSGWKTTPRRNPTGEPNCPSHDPGEKSRNVKNAQGFCMGFDLTST